MSLPKGQLDLFALHHPAVLLTHRLFRSLKDGTRSQRFEIHAKLGEEHFEFRGPDLLGVDDLRVFCAIVALAGSPGWFGLAAEPATPEGRELRQRLQITGPMLQTAPTIAVQGSFRHLAALVGRKGFSGATAMQLRDSLERLRTVTVFIGAKRAGVRNACQLLARYASVIDGDRAEFLVAINPLMAAVVLGEQPYRRVDLAAMAQLRDDRAALLFARLCGVIDPGKSKGLLIDTIAGYLGDDEVDLTPAARRKRRSRARATLATLRTIGWGATQSRTATTASPEKWLITRPAAREPE